MGGCWSCYDGDSRRHESAYAPRDFTARPPQPAFRRPTPIASSSQSNYVPYSYYDKAIACDPSIRQVVIRHQVYKPKQRTVVKPPSQIVKPKPEPLYGEFKCSCGYFWISLLSWRDKYQQCKRCKSYVRPKNQRALLPTDYKRDKDDVGEHPRELCQMCQQLGRHCGSKSTTRK